MANTRKRTKCRISLKRKNPPVLCVLTYKEVEDENTGITHRYKKGIFVERDELERYKERYKDKLEVLF